MEKGADLRVGSRRASLAQARMLTGSTTDVRVHVEKGLKTLPPEEGSEIDVYTVTVYSSQVFNGAGKDASQAVRRT